MELDRVSYPKKKDIISIWRDPQKVSYLCTENVLGYALRYDTVCIWESGGRSGNSTGPGGAER